MPTKTKAPRKAAAKEDLCSVQIDGTFFRPLRDFCASQRGMTIKGRVETAIAELLAKAGHPIKL